MEQENNMSIHDTINLDEIKELLEDGSPQEASEPVPQAAPVQAPDDRTEDGKTQPEEKEPLQVELFNLLHDVAIILTFVTVLFVFVVRLVGVEGDSMLPTLHNRDFLLLESNFLYGEDHIENGDIVVLNVPYYEGQLIVKRVIATEGQTVDIDFDAHEVYVDGVLLEEDYVNAPIAFNWSGDYALSYPATVPEGCIFVLGDNRNDSTDSRFAPVGMIDTRCVLGKVRFVLLPGQTQDNSGRAVESRDWSRIGLVS